MTRLGQNHPLIQWAYLFEPIKPLQTSTCALFWRSALVTPLKLLMPAGLVVVFAMAIASMLLNTFAPPEWIPEFLRARPRSTTDDAFVVAVLGVAAAAIVAVAVGQWLGLWGYLHRFCLPVEIEGGFVRKGVCPADWCTGRLVVADDATHWRCLKCTGVFLPPAPKPEATS